MWEILVANAFLGVSQGLTWSTTVIMKIDLAGAERRGLAMGLNEFAGYVAVAASALATGWIAARWGLRPEPFYLGVVFVALGLGLSVFAVRETHHHVKVEARLHAPAEDVGDATTAAGTDAAAHLGSRPRSHLVVGAVRFHHRTVSALHHVDVCVDMLS